jgi:hypothetical protein
MLKMVDIEIGGAELRAVPLACDAGNALGGGRNSGLTTVATA